MQYFMTFLSSLLVLVLTPSIAVAANETRFPNGIIDYGAASFGTKNPAAASAEVEILSTTKGLLLPRMTTTQRNAISSPAEGLVVYDTSLHSCYQRTNSAWVGFGTPGGSDKQVQFNDSGSFGGDSGLTFDKGTGALATGGPIGIGAAPATDGTLEINGGNGYGLSERVLAFKNGSAVMDYLAESLGSNRYCSGSVSGDFVFRSTGTTGLGGGGVLFCTGSTAGAGIPGFHVGETSLDFYLPSDFGVNEVTNSRTPTTGNDLANKAYVDANVGAGTVHPIFDEITTSGSGTWNLFYAFRITSGSATAASTYTNNAVTFTTYRTVSSSTLVYMSGSGPPASSGTLTKASGTGDATLTFSTYFAPQYLEVSAVGSGGGGCASAGNTGGGSGQSGTDGAVTTFGSSLITANGGAKCVFTGANATAPGDGGTASVADPAMGPAYSGAGGGGATYNGTSVGQDGTGGMGGVSCLGGAGSSGSEGATAGTNAKANTGSGGGGAGWGASSLGQTAGAGGGAGGCAMKVIVPSPSATYSYAVGAKGTGGSAGTGGAAGGDGADGDIGIWIHF